MLIAGVFEFHPKLRIGFLEAQNSWVPGITVREIVPCVSRVRSGRGRNPALSADHRFLGHRYSPASRM